jgi:hypothetical protein
MKKKRQTNDTTRVVYKPRLSPRSIVSEGGVQNRLCYSLSPRGETTQFTTEW